MSREMTDLLIELKVVRAHLDEARKHQESTKVEYDYWTGKVEALKERLRIVTDDIDRAAR